MIYTRWANREDAPLVSKLGFGSTRFLPEDLKDAAGLDRCASLVVHALEKGINYFDVAPTYSSGKAETILGNALAAWNEPVYISAKSGLSIDKTEEDIRRRIDSTLERLRFSRIEFYHIWSVMGYNDYLEIIKPGGLYEGAYRAKEEGLIRYLCISLHCDIPDTLKIIEDGRFEGLTISMNAMNYQKWSPVLEAAKERKMGIATMNSLAGGTITKYSSLFEGLDGTDDPVSVKALRFLGGFKEIDVILSGMSTEEQIDENCSAFDKPICPEGKTDFVVPVKAGLCSGCQYCLPCTVDIPIPVLMQAYNHKLIMEASDSALSEQETANEVMSMMRSNGAFFPSLNECISCQKCMERCTQKLNISGRISELQNLAGKYHYTRASVQARIENLINECDGAKVIAVWPSGVYTSRILDLIDDLEFESRCEYFNSSGNSSFAYGKTFRGKIVHSPSEFVSTVPEITIIMSYSKRHEIYKQLIGYNLPSSCRILLFHPLSEDEIDWFARGV